MIALPWDMDHEVSPAPAKRLERDDERGHKDRNRRSDRGQDDSRWERHSHKRSSSSQSSKGNLAGSGSSRSCSSTESEDDCPAGVTSSRNWTTRDEGPAGVGSSWSQTTTDSWSHFLRGPDCHRQTLWAIRLRVGLQLEPLPLGTGTGLQAIGLPPPARKVLLPWSPVELELAQRTWLLSTVELEWDLRAWLPPTVREPFPLGTGPRLTCLETSPRDPSPSGIEVTADASPAGAGALQNWSAVDCPDCFPGGRIFQVKIRHRLFTHLQQLTELTQPAGAHQWNGRTIQLRSAVRMDQADSVRVVSMATHTAGDTGPQSTQLTGPLQPPVQQPVTMIITLERVQIEPWRLYQFSLQCQFMTEIQHCPLFLYRLWWVCIKSTQHGSALYWHGCAGPSDLAAQMGTSILQQQAQDVYWIQPPQFGPLDRLRETCQSSVLDWWKSGRTSEKYGKTNKTSLYNHV